MLVPPLLAQRAKPTCAQLHAALSRHMQTCCLAWQAKPKRDTDMQCMHGRRDPARLDKCSVLERQKICTKLAVSAGSEERGTVHRQW